RAGGESRPRTSARAAIARSSCSKRKGCGKYHGAPIAGCSRSRHGKSFTGDRAGWPRRRRWHRGGGKLYRIRRGAEGSRAGCTAEHGGAAGEGGSGLLSALIFFGGAGSSGRRELGQPFSVAVVPDLDGVLGDGHDREVR